MIKHYCDLGELVRRLGGTFAAAGPLSLYVWRDCSCRLAMHVARQHKSVGWRLTAVGLERGNESLAAPHIAQKKPGETEGISRRTWYRRRPGTGVAPSKRIAKRWASDRCHDASRLPPREPRRHRRRGTHPLGVVSLDGGVCHLARWRGHPSSAGRGHPCVQPLPRYQRLVFGGARDASGYAISAQHHLLGASG
jgi:hypothetical protein